MSETRRRRVMVDSDDETGGEIRTKDRGSPSPAGASAKKRRLEVPAIDDDDNDEMVIEGSALMDSSDEDQIERKRRRQLAERWSNLEKDSDHELSGESDNGGGRGRAGRTGLAYSNPWRQSTRSRDATISRLLVKDPRSEDEEDVSGDESDGLDGFIVDSPTSDMEEEEVEEGRETGRRRRRTRSGQHGSTAKDTRKGGNKTGGNSRGGEVVVDLVVGVISDRSDLSSVGEEDPAGVEPQNVGRKKKGAKRTTGAGGDETKGKKVTPASSPDKISETRSSGRSKRAVKGGGKGGGGRAKKISRSKTENEDDRDDDDDAKEDDDGGGEEGDAKRTGKRKVGKKREEKESSRKTPSRRVTRSAKAKDRDDDGSDVQDDGEEGGEEDGEEDGEKGAVERGIVKKRARRGIRRSSRAGGMGSGKGIGEDDGEEEGEEEDDEEDSGEAVRGAAKRNKIASKRAKRGSKSSKSSSRRETRSSKEDGTGGEDGAGGDRDGEAESGEEGNTNASGVAKRSKVTKKKAKKGKKCSKSSPRSGTRSGTRNVVDVSDESEATAPSTTEAQTSTANARRGRRTRSSVVNYREMLRDSSSVRSSSHSSSSGGSGGEEDDSEGEERGGALPKRCGRDDDADEDDGFAVNLREDGEDNDYEDSADDGGSDADASGKHGRRSKGGRRGGRYRQDSIEGDYDDSEGDDNTEGDNDDDDGDVSFSHAALFHELERSQETGLSSLSVETMTFDEAFLLYVEYLAKATADKGVGEAFMKKCVAQPRLPEHARYSKAREMVEKKVCISRESLCGTWRQDFRDSILRYPHYSYQRVDTDLDRQCGACNRHNPTAVVAFLSGSSYDPRRAWEGLRWDKYLPEHWDDPTAMALSKQKAVATYFLGETCRHKSHLYHSLTHYKLYLVCKVAEKMRAGKGLEPENFRGEGGPRTSKKKKQLLLNFSENEFESLKALLKKADELNGVKWGSKVGVRGAGGKTFLQLGAASSILDWLSGEAQPGQYGEIDLGIGGERSEAEGSGNDNSHQEESEEEFVLEEGRPRQLRQSPGSRGGRYD